MSGHGTLHHVELWVPDLARAAASLGWLLETLGYQRFQTWDAGRSWRLGPTYLVVEQSPALTADRHDRCRPGLNHLAFHVEDAATVDQLTADAARHGWRLMFPEKHPHAGGAEHYAAYLENDDGFEVELVSSAGPC
ncbi:VOC family protein [Amycolatopsis silviterrae]|uniref:VOC family protein n=1 Tax=Amycolatopsis silviterrae TaxID=1656914 RepID=A0ABW5HIS5_9PSEU